LFRSRTNKANLNCYPSGCPKNSDPLLESMPSWTTSIVISSSSLLEELLDVELLTSVVELSAYGAEFNASFSELLRGGYHISKLSRMFIWTATLKRSGYYFRIFLSQQYANLFLSLRACIQTRSKLPSLHTFSVMAIVVSKFKTACHQAPGTNMVSPGYWMHSMIFGILPCG